MRSGIGGRFFVDVGANIGGYTIRFGRRGSVFAFEPHPSNFTLLAINTQLNNLKSVRLYRKALGDHTGTAKLFLSKYHGRHSTIGEGEYVEIECATLDSMLETEARIETIKVDVEGAECSILQGQSMR